MPYLEPASDGKCIKYTSRALKGPCKTWAASGSPLQLRGPCTDKANSGRRIFRVLGQTYADCVNKCATGVFKKCVAFQIMTSRISAGRSHSTAETCRWTDDMNNVDFTKVQGAYSVFICGDGNRAKKLRIAPCGIATAGTATTAQQSAQKASGQGYTYSQCGGTKGQPDFKKAKGTCEWTDNQNKYIRVSQQDGTCLMDRRAGAGYLEKYYLTGFQCEVVCTSFPYCIGYAFNSFGEKLTISGVEDGYKCSESYRFGGACRVYLDYDRVSFFDTVAWFGPVSKKMTTEKQTWVYKAFSGNNNINSAASGGGSISMVQPKSFFACFTKAKGCDWITVKYRSSGRVSSYDMKMRLDMLHSHRSQDYKVPFYGGTSANKDNPRNILFQKRGSDNKMYWHMELSVGGRTVQLDLKGRNGTMDWQLNGQPATDLVAVDCGLCSKIVSKACKTHRQGRKYCSLLPTLDGTRCLARSHANACTDEEPFEQNKCKSLGDSRSSYCCPASKMCVTNCKTYCNDDMEPGSKGGKEEFLCVDELDGGALAAAIIVGLLSWCCCCGCAYWYYDLVEDKRW